MRAELLGFNEAEAHAPRILAGSSGTSAVVGFSFNEAEAHAPRIRPYMMTCGPKTSRFNEAEAHAPRIP